LTPYLGPAYSDDDIEAALATSALSFEKLSDIDLLSRTAKLLKDGFVIGWHQGLIHFAGFQFPKRVRRETGDFWGFFHGFLC
jgi:predicted NodU family carbamoyl transferase